MTKRIDKVNELIYRELNTIILRDIDFPEDVFVTITAVNITPDLKNGTIRVSIFPANKRGQVLRLLNNKAAFLNRSLRKRLSMKFIPNLTFLFDDTEEEASKIDDLINSIQ